MGALRVGRLPRAEAELSECFLLSYISEVIENHLYFVGGCARLDIGVSNEESQQVIS